MEPSVIKYIVSILLIGLGIFYFLKPDKPAKIFGFSDRYIKISGLIIIALGVYYILVMLGFVPMIDYWK